MSRDMADRLGLGPGVRQLKLGPTFTSNKSTAFHTLKYDFKPASVDVSKIATVDVGPNNTMTVTVPHLDGAGIPHTIFKGSQRPYSKECVLIIDRLSGEITLERLSSNVQLKKTRVEPKAQSSTHLAAPTVAPALNNLSTTNRPITPNEFKRSPTHGRSTSRTKVASGKKREPTVQLHPKQHQQPSPMRVSPYDRRSPPNVPSNNKNYSSSPVTQRPTVHAGALSHGSLPMIGLDFDDFHVTPQPPVPQMLPKPPVATTNERIFVSHPSPIPTTSRDNEVGILSDSSSTSSSSGSSDSDSEPENVPVPTIANGNINGKIPSPLLNMPDNFLNDDLQLSESESDSD